MDATSGRSSQTRRIQGNKKGEPNKRDLKQQRRDFDFHKRR